MRVMPKGRLKRITFCKTHLDRWVANADQIGAPPEMIAQLTTETEAAQAALAEQKQAQQAAQAATAKLNDAVKKMSETASIIILHARNQVRQSGDQVYSLAWIPRIKKKSVGKPPGEPSGFKMQLLQIGHLRLTWKCKNPRGSQGTLYKVWRQIDGGAFTYLGITAEKKLTDATIPAGSKSVLYRIQGERLKYIGPVAEYLIQLGSNGKMRDTFQVQSSRPRIAA